MRAVRWFLIGCAVVQIPLLWVQTNLEGDYPRQFFLSICLALFCFLEFEDMYRENR